MSRNPTVPKKVRPPTDGATWFGKVLRGGGETYFIKTADSHSPLESARWAPLLGWFPPQYWSSAGYPRGGSWRDRHELYLTRPACPYPARSDKSCRRERSSRKPGTESQHWPGADLDRSCIPRCP